MKISFLGSMVAALSFIHSHAQPYITGGKTRHRFAQLNAGVDLRLFSKLDTRSFIVNPAGMLEQIELPHHKETRLIIGGTHFWGHADFYVAFPIASFGKSPFRTGVETGARFFPRKIEHNKMSPYMGAAWLINRFRQGRGVQQIRHTFPLMAGLVYNNKNHLFDLGLGYNYNNRHSYYVAATTSAMIKSPSLWISAGYKLMLETTAGAEKGWVSGETKRQTADLAATGVLNGVTLAGGPSSAIFLKSSSHNRSVAPYLQNHKIARIFPEFGIGYYLHKPDLQFNLAYRANKSFLEAYGFVQEARRKALTFEIIKFLGDYHGFVPFAGPAISHEWLEVEEKDQAGMVARSPFRGLKPGLSFGWDIRPDRLQLGYLRTNLRWFPNLGVRMHTGKKVFLDQLEFNFIQLVLFPSRIF